MRTIDKDESLEICDCDVIHICFGYSDKFVEYVNDYLDIYKSDHVIIHSTVSIGTIAKIKRDCIYSPVRGRHANGFMGDIRKYIKYYSGTHIDISDWFEDVDVIKVDSIESLEFAKIMSTTYTLVNVLFEKWVYKMCKDNNLDYEFVYKGWNKTYNDNVKGEWQRPIYEHIKGIGGHCLLPNLELFKDDEFIKVLKIMVDKYEKY